MTRCSALLYLRALPTLNAYFLFVWIKFRMSCKVSKSQPQQFYGLAGSSVKPAHCLTKNLSEKVGF